MWYPTSCNRDHLALRVSLDCENEYHSSFLFSSALTCNFVTNPDSKTSNTTSQAILIITHLDTVPNADDMPWQDLEKLCETPLQAAAYQGDIERLQELIHAGADPHAVSGVFGTALQAACYRGQLHTSRMLLKLGANANFTSSFHGNPIHTAAYDGNEELIELLCEYGADPNAKGGIYGNALITAAKGGHQAAVKSLSMEGVEWDAEGCEEYPTALYAASLHGHREVVALLLHWGTDPNKEYAHGKFALGAAVHKGHKDIVLMLIKHGAFLDRECRNGLNIGELTMHMAAKGGHMDLVRSLLTHPCTDANSPNEEVLSPLLIAACHGHTDVVRIFLGSRKSINTIAGDRSGSTALMIAVSYGYLDVVRAILEHCARRAGTQVYDQGIRSLIMAVSGGNQGLVLLLLEHGVKAWEPVKRWQPRDGQTKTPLITAIETGHEAITFLLLRHGAKIDDTDRPENKPMDMAVSKGYRKIGKLLSFGDGKSAIADRDRRWKSVSRVKDCCNINPDNQSP